MDGTLIHASCVAAEGAGLLILGRPGAGKSRLALELIALGAALVADDQTLIRRCGDDLLAAPPPRLAGMIEARGIGLLRAPHVAPVRLALALDLDAEAGERLPPRRAWRLLGAAVPLILRPESVSPAALMAALRWGPPLDPDLPVGQKAPCDG
jgi:HPr kinase/phosphorylase